MSRSSRSAWLGVGVACLMWFASIAAAAEPLPAKRVLLLHQELASRPYRARFNAAFIDALRAGDNLPFDIYEEAIDPADNPATIGYLKTKYAEQPIDVLVVVGARALDFAKNNRALFGNPTIVAAVATAAQLADPDGNITGLQGGQAIQRTIDLALALRPDTDRLIVVDGTRDDPRSVRPEVEHELAGVGKHVELMYLRNLRLRDLTGRLAAAPAHSVVLFMRQTMRNESQDLDPFEGLSQVLRASPVPVFSQMEEYVGRGIVGGYVWEVEPDARRMAAMAQQIANGARAKDVPIEPTHYSTIIDWRQLQRWNIPASLVPKGSVVLFRQPTFFEQYRAYVVVGALAFALQFALIFGLLVERVRRRRAEEDSHNNAERYRSVVDTQSELICRFIPDTTLTFVNDAFCRCWQTTREALIGQRFIDLVPETDRPVVLERIANLLTGSDSIEHPVTLPDGGLGWQHWIHHVIQDDHGRLVEIQGVGRDITDRKRAEDAIGQLETRNSAMLRAIPDLMFVLRRDGTYVDYHARDPKLLFAPPNMFIGKKIRDVMPPALADTFVEALNRTAETEEPIVVEYELPLDGPRHFEARLVHAGPDRVLTMVRDVTESKRAGELNRHLAGRLIVSQEDERHRIARELHDNVSQKIALLMINIDSLAGAASGDGHKFRELSARAGEIASDIHHLSHELHPSKLQALGLVTALEALCRDVSISTDLQVVFSHGIVPPTIDQDVSLCLYRIVQEALHNVGRHSQATRARVRLASADDVLTLRISDSGVGFDPLTAEATGLGLISMRERVTFLSGQLTIDSSRGTGTRIDVRIPLIRPASGSQPLISQTA